MNRCDSFCYCVQISGGYTYRNTLSYVTKDKKKRIKTPLNKNYTLTHNIYFPVLIFTFFSIPPTDTITMKSATYALQRSKHSHLLITIRVLLIFVSIYLRGILITIGKQEFLKKNIIRKSQFLVQNTTIKGKLKMKTKTHLHCILDTKDNRIREYSFTIHYTHARILGRVPNIFGYNVGFY